MRKILWLVPLIAIAAQTETNVVMISPESANWQHEGSAPPDAQSVLLRGETEMLVRYEAGHKFAPHWHSANERMVVIEGMICISKTRCGFYVFWDGKLDYHR